MEHTGIRRRRLSRRMRRRPVGRCRLWPSTFPRPGRTRRCSRSSSWRSRPGLHHDGADLLVHLVHGHVDHRAACGKFLGKLGRACACVGERLAGKGHGGGGVLAAFVDDHVFDFVVEAGKHGGHVGHAVDAVGLEVVGGGYVGGQLVDRFLVEVLDRVELRGDFGLHVFFGAGLRRAGRQHEAACQRRCGEQHGEQVLLFHTYPPWWTDIDRAGRGSSPGVIVSCAPRKAKRAAAWQGEKTSLYVREG